MTRFVPMLILPMPILHIPKLRLKRERGGKGGGHQKHKRKIQANSWHCLPSAFCSLSFSPCCHSNQLGSLQFLKVHLTQRKKPTHEQHAPDLFARQSPRTAG